MIYSIDEIRTAAGNARPILNKMLTNPDPEIAKVLASRDEVISRFQPIFLPENTTNLNENDYRSFLIYENNQHWKSLQRMGPAHTANMDLLRKAIGILVDETRPIKERLDELLPPDGSPMISRFGRATITPILMITYPDKYAVLNNPVEAGLRKLGLWPDFDRKTAFSKKYYELNQIILALARELSVDLWTLDTLWWHILSDVGPIPPEPDDNAAVHFGLERYLQEFIRDNWDSIPQMREWYLYEEDGDVVGFEYNTGEIGRIDLLARHKTESRWLVIELKRNQASDQSVGQVLRYMGWVNAKLADPEDKVEGLIISSSADSSLDYAIKYTSNIQNLFYEVKFTLNDPKR